MRLRRPPQVVRRYFHSHGVNRRGFGPAMIGPHLEAAIDEARRFPDKPFAVVLIALGGGATLAWFAFLA